MSPTKKFCGIASVAILLATLTLARGVPPTAQDDNTIPADAVELPAKEVNRYLVIAVSLTRYKQPWFDRPRVFMTTEWFTSRGCDNCGVMGVTLPNGPKHIFLHASLIADPIHRRDVLVHELTHWLQFTSGWAWDMHSCTDREAHEIEAYAVQYVFLTTIQKRAQDFRVPDFQCLMYRGAHDDSPYGVIGPPVITKY